MNALLRLLRLLFYVAPAILPIALLAVSPNTNLSQEALASRFLGQATFGPTPESIAALRASNNNFAQWIDQEAAKPTTSVTALLYVDKASGRVPAFNQVNNRRARTEIMITAPDQLRHRMAYALSQIMVISDVDNNIANGQEGTSAYYDMLARNAFGNFRTLLMDVTRHPMMGRYLSHYKNRKANPATGTRPDENYAREVMQLFSIGVYQLQSNGNFVNGPSGQPAETYTSEDVSNFARVFTGLMDASTTTTGSGAGGNDFPGTSPNFTEPMRMWEKQHDTDAKTLLRYPGARKPNLPAGQSGLQDLQDAIDNLVEHPNTAPFISRQLIQRFVTSNPSEGYVSRVAGVFVNNGAGVRGDLLAVLKAILLDNEARSPAFLTDPEHGKLREPFIRITHLLRAFRFSLASSSSVYDFGSTVSENTIGQWPMSSGSVFNFYSPDYEPPGPIGNANLVAPEFQILNTVFSITIPNAVYNLVQNTAGQARLNLADQEALAGSPTALVENVDLLLTHGTLSAESRANIVKAVESVTSAMATGGSNLNQTRARLAVYLVATSPDYAIQK